MWELLSKIFAWLTGKKTNGHAVEYARRNFDAVTREWEAMYHSMLDRVKHAEDKAEKAQDSVVRAHARALALEGRCKRCEQINVQLIKRLEELEKKNGNGHK